VRYSYHINALGKVSYLCTPPCLFTALGINDTEHQATYRRLFTSHAEGELLTEIRAVTQPVMALSNYRFKNELTSPTGRRLHTLPPGRKLRWRKS
jgi:putative transposase